MTAVTTERVTGAEVLARVHDLLPGVAARAAQGERERELPAESAAAFLDAGLARVLTPRRFGGDELGLDVWFDAMQAIGAVDAAHAWCAGLMTHHAQYIAQFPLAAQEAVWADGPDVAMTTSFHPTTTVVAADGGYRLTGEGAWCSGIGNSTWCVVGGMLPVSGPPTPALFLLPKSDYTVRDVWHTTGMRGTGSNVVVTDDVFVPADFVLSTQDLLDGTGPGGRIHPNPIYRAPMVTFAGLTFVTPILGAAKGALQAFREFATPRMNRTNANTSNTTARIRMGRAAADIDAAELLLRRSLALSEEPVPASIELRARAMRDYGRAAELIVGAVNDLIALSGTAGFATTNPLQQYWRDVNFAARHITMNPDNNYAYWSTTQLGIPRDPAEFNQF